MIKHNNDWHIAGRKWHQSIGRKIAGWFASWDWRVATA